MARNRSSWLWITAVAASLFAATAGADPKAWTRSILDRDEAGRVAFVSRPYAGTVVAVDVSGQRVLWETAVGRAPGAVLYEGPPGRRLFVALTAGNEVAVLDPASGRVRARLPVGATPCGLDRLGEDRLVVTLRSRHRVVVWNLEAGRVVASRSVAPFPCGVSVASAGGEIYVTHRFDPLLTVLGGGDARPAAEVRGPAEMNQTAGVLVAPGGGRLFLPHVLSYSHRPDPSYINSVLPAVSVVDTSRRRFVPDARIEPAFVDRPVNGPEALALFRDGRALLVVNSRSNDLSAISLAGGLSLGTIPVGRFPTGIVISPDQRSAWVANAHEHSLSTVDLETLTETGRISYGEEPLPPGVARGRDLFHDAASSRMTKNRWLSCSSCHPGGGSDGRVWNLPGRGRLLTKDLRGVGRTLPAGWRGDRDELQDEELFIREFLRGSGLSERPPHPAPGQANAGLSRDLDALAAYLAWLAPPGDPDVEERGPSAAAARGRALFLSPRTGCATCHPPPRFTVSGGETSPRFAGLVTPAPTAVELDVPSLLGLSERRRFLHDGRAERLGDVFLRWNEQDRHGRTSHLTAAELADLEAYLRSLPPPSNGGLPDD